MISVVLGFRLWVRYLLTSWTGKCEYYWGCDGGEVMGSGWHCLWLPSIGQCWPFNTIHLIIGFIFTMQFRQTRLRHILNSEDCILMSSCISMSCPQVKLSLHCKCEEVEVQVPVRSWLQGKLNPRPQLGCYFYCRTHNMQNKCDTKVGKTFGYRDNQGGVNILSNLLLTSHMK